ncbi:MAG TPA: hypothetical protein VFA01_02305 [Candidatus Dormibacteraeota bacterium]|jgi:hypothetical protein|nr:hypothetical protein [Candidatus Dormibacteraeota bacterium]
MSATACAHCGTPIVDPATLRRRDGATYCCGNCLAVAEGRSQPTTLVCAHCATPIVDAATETQVDNEIFCCLNCAEAHAGVGPRAGS